jgi:3'-phosphoadenosine 5'-phosphosulfate (PAPS) 3'-phosphatase
MKDVNDPVTTADYKIQTMFTKGIKKSWNHVHIVG